MATPEEQAILAEMAVGEHAELTEGGQQPAVSVARIRAFFQGFVTLREMVKTQLAPAIGQLNQKATAQQAATTKEAQDRAAADTALGARIDQLETRVRALEPPP